MGARRRSKFGVRAPLQDLDLRSGTQSGTLISSAELWPADWHTRFSNWHVRGQTGTLDLKPEVQKANWHARSVSDYSCVRQDSPPEWAGVGARARERLTRDGRVGVVATKAGSRNAPDQVARGDQPLRNSFRRLWVAQIRFHSACTHCSPRSRKRRRPRASLI